MAYVSKSQVEKATCLGELRAFRASVKQSLSCYFFYDSSPQRWLDRMEIWSESAESSFEKIRKHLFDDQREWVIEELRFFREICLRVHRTEVAAVEANCAIALRLA